MPLPRGTAALGQQLDRANAGTSIDALDHVVHRQCTDGGAGHGLHLNTRSPSNLNLNLDHSANVR